MLKVAGYSVINGGRTDYRFKRDVVVEDFEEYRKRKKEKFKHCDQIALVKSEKLSDEEMELISNMSQEEICENIHLFCPK